MFLFAYRVFDFIVNKVNASMAFSGNANVVGVLDIYGFEIFDHNSFEQVSIPCACQILIQATNLASVLYQLRQRASSADLHRVDCKASSLLLLRNAYFLYWKTEASRKNTTPKE